MGSCLEAPGQKIPSRSRRIGPSPSEGDKFSSPPIPLLPVAPWRAWGRDRWLVRCVCVALCLGWGFLFSVVLFSDCGVHPRDVPLHRLVGGRGLLMDDVPVELGARRRGACLREDPIGAVLCFE
ncbi:hypothetical protein Taro_051536, partial [Colocasia esculenta]|nr:hypothetical protein [Colocasia esculenta]